MLSVLCFVPFIAEMLTVPWWMFKGSNICQYFKFHVNELYYSHEPVLVLKFFELLNVLDLFIIRHLATFAVQIPC